MFVLQMETLSEADPFVHRRHLQRGKISEEQSSEEGTDRTDD